ncbi:hypothetical protein AOLI_G00056050 [Acnodon oligacanthus]
MVRKLQATGSLISSHGGGRPKMPQDPVDDVRHRLQQSPTNPPRRPAQETRRCPAACQWVSAALTSNQAGLWTPGGLHCPPEWEDSGGSRVSALERTEGLTDKVTGKDV